jgi:RNA polymerase sigma-70 factor (ECF subfamily)
MTAKHSFEDREESEVVSAAKAGDAAAFEELVRRHGDKMFRRALSMMRDEDTALDMAQMAWIKAWKRLTQFQGDSSFATWMTRVTINVCLDHIRKAKRWKFAESIEEMEENSGGVERKLPIIETNPTERLEREELKKKIDKALAQLSEGHRAVIMMHTFEEMAYKEIAESMGCSIGTVMSRLFYARRNLASILKRILEEEGKS